jgi:3alpha(or 20beta)-hydroxysteroid dehydrogenase
MGRMDGKVALVTGAARGMGEATARLIAAEGGHVVVADRLEDQGRAVAESLGESAVFAQHDVADENSWAKVVASATEQFGGLDVLINNAAIWRTGRIEHGGGARAGQRPHPSQLRASGRDRHSND